MTNESHVRELLELGKSCTKTSVDQMINCEPINFEALRDDLERTFGLLNQFTQLPVGLLPERIMTPIIATLRPLTKSLDAIRCFSHDQVDPLAARDRLLAQYRRQAEGFFAAALRYNCLSCALEGPRRSDDRCASCILEQ
jgi:hypothetical protein